MFSFIRGFFRAIWNLVTWTRVFLFNIIFLVIVVAIFQGAAQAPEIQIPDNSALFIAPSGVLVDQSSYNPSVLDALTGSPDRPLETVVRDITEAITYAKDDANISGLILRLDYLQSAGMSKVEEIGQAINAFKSSGKPVVAYADTLGQQQYLLASYADEIYVNSLGGVYLNGFGAYRNYYKSAADKLHVKFHVFRVGEYKDAVEPFFRDSMSEQSREHIDAWITKLWQRFAGTIEAHRELQAGSIDNFVNLLDSNLSKVGGDSALLAMENGLVDAVYSRNALRKALKQKFGTNQDEHVNAIGMYAYLGNPMLNVPEEHNAKVGLIVAAGNIMDGEQPEGSIGADTLSTLIQRAREDDSLKALVVRVDSGGGSAFASEVIREELALTQEEGLPVYISMGSVAASGGYWMSAPATEIWATPSTLTGSIGVFGLMPNLSESLEKIGIYSDGVGTSAIADAYHLDRAMSPQTQRVIQSSVENIYQRFLALVAEARGKTPEEVDNIAQGRVWDGETALELGLVDKLGSLNDTLEHAAKAQGLEQYSVKTIERELSQHEQIIRAIMEQASVSSSIIGTGSAGHASAFKASAWVQWLNKLNMLQDLELIEQSLDAKAGNYAGASIYTHCGECIAP